MVETVEVLFVVNGTTNRRTYVGIVSATQILDSGVGTISFVEPARDDRDRKVLRATFRRCESITRYVE